MGTAHSTIINKTAKKVCVVTFNEADSLYTSRTLRNQQYNML
jgi:hypothetical protein